MTPGAIEAYLHAQIPLSAHMGVRVLVCDAAGVTLAAPLSPNVNHRATAFGGSISAVAILAAWTWLHATLQAAGAPARLVIQRNRVEYLAPVMGDFEARCVAPAPAAVEGFLRTWRRRGKSRIELEVTLTCAGARVATLAGEFVALPVA